MEVTSLPVIVDIITSVGAIGILGVYFLWIQPQMQREVLATFKDIAQEYHAIRTADNEAVAERTEEIVTAINHICKFRHDP